MTFINSPYSAASRKKRLQKTAMSFPPHDHLSSDTEAKPFSPRKHRSLDERQLHTICNVVSSSGRPKRRCKAVTQPAEPTELNLSSLSQEEAENSQTISVKLTEILGDEKLWDEK